MLKSSLYFGLLFCAAGAFAQNSGAIAGIGAIAGNVVDAATGKPLAGVILTAKRTGLPPFSVSIASNAAGIYLLSGLPEGAFTICAHFPGDGYLDPCQWSLTPPVVNLTANQGLTENQVKLIPGSVLHVRVNDPGGLLKNKTQAGRPEDLSVGVWGTRGLYHAAHIVQTDSGGVDYQVTIPRDMRVAVHVTSQHLKLADAKGTALPGNFLQQTFQHATSAATPPSFTFAITGVIQ